MEVHTISMQLRDIVFRIQLNELVKRLPPVTEALKVVTTHRQFFTDRKTDFSVPYHFYATYGGSIKMKTPLTELI